MTKQEKREYDRKYYLLKREQIRDQQKEYYQTPMGRAQALVNGYKQADKKANRGECTLTPQWIIDNIFTKKCAHCDKSGWQIIGCNRLDNSRPHTPDNVEPCCFEHNNELNGVELSKKVYQYTLSGELVKVWKSTQECGRNGYNQSNVASCCRGNLKTYKAFQWSYEPIEKKT